jgi:hypothetical protein
MVDHTPSATSGAEPGAESSARGSSSNGLAFALDTIKLSLWESEQLKPGDGEPSIAGPDPATKTLGVGDGLRRLSGTGNDRLGRGSLR